MKNTYYLSAKVTISISTRVEAESLEKAIKIAQERHIETYNYGDKNQDMQAWISEEFDGDPTDIQDTDF